MMFSLFLILFCLISSYSHAQNPPQILTSIAPIASLVSTITGQTTDYLIKTDLHDYQLRPSDRKKIENAEIFFYGSDVLESFVSKIEGTKIALDDGKENPHFWLSITKMIKAGYKIANVLGEKYPAQAKIYQQNAKNFDSQMTKFLTTHKNQLKKGVPYFVFHDAYAPLEQDFGISAVDYIKATPHQQNSAKKMADLTRKMAQFSKFCLFLEPETSPQAVQTFIESKTVIIKTLDPLGIEISPVDSAFYEKLIANIITQMNSCFSQVAE